MTASSVPSSVPSYCRQRENNRADRAFVRINGKKIKLGVYDSLESRQRYVELIKGVPAYDSLQVSICSPCPTVAELMVGYLDHARTYYQKPDGSPGREFELIREALRIVRRHGSDFPASEFGPKRLKQVRQSFIDDGMTRKFINKQVSRIVRMFKWAAAEELIAVTVPQTLAMVPGLKKGRTKAREAPPVLPVPDADLEATVPQLSQQVADMVCLQRLIGCRPGELVSMKPSQIDRSGEVWFYVPEHHKTLHQGKKRQIPIGPRAQTIVNKYLFGEWCFEANDGRPYQVASYRRAVTRACERAGVSKWTPHRLRHSAATAIRREFGLEAAQLILGHANADVTQVYAERDLAKAAEVAMRIG